MSFFKLNLIFEKKGHLESNTKIVQWDDGSCHLMIGDVFYNLQLKDFTGELCTLYERPPEVNQNSVQQLLYFSHVYT